MRQLFLLFALWVSQTIGLVALNDLVASGDLCVWKRPNDYIERRSLDGYEEPLEVWVIGTNHRSTRSAQDVQRVVELLQPDATVIELCRSRISLLEDNTGQDNREGSTVPFSGNGDFQSDFVKSLRLGGFLPLALRLAMAGAIDRTVGVLAEDGDEAAVGEDFRRAYATSEAVGAAIVLGDRPIEISLARFVNALSLVERVGLSATLLRFVAGGAPSTEAAAAAARQVSGATGATNGTSGDNTGSFGSMSSMFEEAIPNKAAWAALTSERDSYLAWSLKRSRAVSGTRRVVGVVGRAHLSGVMAELDRDRGGSVLSFQELTAKPTPTRVSRVLRVVWEVALWGSTVVLVLPYLPQSPVSS